MGSSPATIRFFILSAIMLCLLPCGYTSSWGGGDDIPLYDSRIAEIATAKRFPESSAVVLIDRRIHTWSFRETTMERTFVVKILTREGIEQFGDFISDVYHKQYLAYALEATAVSPRGERTTIESDHIKRVEFGSNEYQYRVAVPGLEIGSIVEIKENIQTEYAITSGHWDFSCRVPTLRSELVFKVPAGCLVRFNFTPKNRKLYPSIEIDDEYEKYTITMEVVPPYTDEPFMPRCHIGNPTVYYHIWQVTMEDYLRFRKIDYDDRLLEWMEEHDIPWELPLGTRSWHEIASSFSDYFNPKTWEDDDRAEEYRSLLNSIIEAMPRDYSTDPMRDLDTILNDFHRRFQGTEIEFFYQNPEMSLTHREGNPFHLAYVLKLILDERNIETSIVIASDAARGPLDERSPDPYTLCRPLLLFNIDTEQCWIDPFAAECGVNQIPWEYQGVKALWLKPNKNFSFITTPLDAAPVNCISRREEIDIDASGHLTGQSRIMLTGQYILEVRREHGIGNAGGNGEDMLPFIDRLFQDKVLIDDITVVTDTKDTITVSCRYSVDDFVHRSGDFMNLDFSGWCDNPALSAFEGESREYEIMFPFPATRSFTLSITTPPDYAIIQYPQDAKHEDKWFSYSRACRHGGDVFMFERTFAIASPRVEAIHYTVAKQVMETIRKFDKESIVLKRGS